MERRPAWGEPVTVRTWPRGSDRLFAVRDYDIRDQADRPLVRGRSGWLVIDMEKRRPLRVQQFMDKLPQNEGLDALPGGGAGLEPGADLTLAGERTARYSDIDYNGHVNNTRYIQWIQDVTDPGLLTNADQLRLDINYLHEVKPGETIGLWTAPITADRDTAAAAAPWNAAAYEGRRPEDGQAVFRAELRSRV
jgi:acyl-ACP thioesterase